MRRNRLMHRRSARAAHEWRTAESGYCVAVHPDAVVCSLDIDHPGDHEAWSAGDPGELIVAWPQSGCAVTLSAADPGQI